jgi:hypothetical protein
MIESTDFRVQLPVNSVRLQEIDAERFCSRAAGVWIDPDQKDSIASTPNLPRNDDCRKRIGLAVAAIVVGIA